MNDRIVYQWTHAEGGTGFSTCLNYYDVIADLQNDAWERGDISLRFLLPTEHPTVEEVKAREEAELAANEAWWAETQAAS